ncbi:hypothetical protein [Priestia megaterium]|nr:hypothetical protein [Priestia megaterium]
MREKELPTIKEIVEKNRQERLKRREESKKKLEGYRKKMKEY